MGQIIASHVDHHYRYSVTEVGSGYLVTIEPREVIGGPLIAQWKHGTEETARACMAVAVAANAALRASSEDTKDTLLTSYYQSDLRHSGLCYRFKDFPVPVAMERPEAVTPSPVSGPPARAVPRLPPHR